MNKILYVEDELFLGQIVKETLEKQDFELEWVSDGAKVLDHLQEKLPDICVLDIMLPNVDGYTLCRQIRGLYPNLPIIFLTAKTETSDLVKGFEAGGTDYIRKPFSIEELIVRIKNQLQLVKANGFSITDSQNKTAIGKYTFYPANYELHKPSGIIKLSHRDLQLISILLSNINRITDRKDLLMSVWGDDSFFNSRNLDVYIRKLRDYFSEDKSIIIQTLKGRGYLFHVRDEVN